MVQDKLSAQEWAVVKRKLHFRLKASAADDMNRQQGTPT